MSAQTVVDISSDEEDDAVKRSTKTRSTGTQPTDSTTTFAKSSPKISLTADKPSVSPPVTTNRTEDIRNIQPRGQSTEATPPQSKQEAPKDRALSGLQTTISTSTPTLPIPPTADDPPKPTPLDINQFRHLVSAGSVPVKDSPLIMSIQSATPASNNNNHNNQNNNKRKATAPLEEHPSRRPRPSLLPPTPYTGTSAHPVPPKKPNSLLWSVPAYKPPPSISPNHSNSQTTTKPPPTTNQPPPPPAKQPSIPNIHAPLATIPTPQPTISSLPQTPTPKSPRPRARESKWTGAQLANLASALEAAFFPTVDAFAARNGKTAKQVRDAYSFLVNKRVFEFCDEGGGDGGVGVGRDGLGGGGEKGKGSGSGRRKVARRFEREMREDRKATEKIMKRVHGREASEGHWACDGMGRTGRGMGKEGAKEKGEEGKEEGKDEGKNKGKGKGRVRGRGNGKGGETTGTEGGS
ncbi:hypothetical protein IMSHALPRED_006378 [Imshaugia aleurites]|uniref:Myb-like domain-containing protein n=1 Tax=Imshaugia aleurites TaxID=172621 RepID=A0A8H3FKJ8_9LECA|nr:hypothetical protein IMSHALPRED_006378 [Imshaugia aleurites]